MVVQGRTSRADELLRLSLLGSFEAQVSGAPVCLPSKKVQALLAHLALRPGRAHDREKVQTLLWAESGKAQVQASLRQALAVLRKAVPPAGLLVIALLSAYSAVVAVREGVARERPSARAMARATWELRPELGLLVLIGAGAATGLMLLDEVAAAAAFYVVVVAFFGRGDLSWRRDLPRLASSSLTLAGAIVVILAMANALMNYVVDQAIPAKVLALLVDVGIEHRWQFLLLLNLFLLLLGMIMEGFSAIFVAVPLVLPFVADLGMRHPAEKMSPFQLGMIFLLNLELAFCLPPLGLNLFLSSVRFDRPLSTLYRAVVPFVAVLAVALLLVSYVPGLSTVAAKDDIAATRALADAVGQPPRAAWMMECVQADPTNPLPCSPADVAKYSEDQAVANPEDGVESP